MKITGYKVLIILGMLILHSLPFLAYYLIDSNPEKYLAPLIPLLINIFVIIESKVYENLFKQIDKQMKKEIKLW